MTSQPKSQPGWFRRWSGATLRAAAKSIDPAGEDETMGASEPESVERPAVGGDTMRPPALDDVSDVQAAADRGVTGELQQMRERLAEIEGRCERLAGRLDAMMLDSPHGLIARPSTSAAEPMVSNEASKHPAPRTTLRPPRLPGAMVGECSTSKPVEDTVGGPAVRGTFIGLSLGTLFSLLEYERCSGQLLLHSGNSLLEFTFSHGSIVRCDLDGARVSAAVGIRSACAWRAATFSFRSDRGGEELDSPRSANALMLEVMRQRDETAQAS